MYCPGVCRCDSLWLFPVMCPASTFRGNSSQIFWLINVWCITHFDDIEPLEAKVHHSIITLCIPLRFWFFCSPTSPPAFHNGSPLGPSRGPSAKSLWNSLRGRERSRARPWPKRCWPIRPQNGKRWRWICASCKKKIPFGATLWSKCNRKNTAGKTTWTLLTCRLPWKELKEVGLR